MKPGYLVCLPWLGLLSVAPATAQQPEPIKPYVGYYQVKNIPDLLLRVYQTEAGGLALVVPEEPDYEMVSTGEHQFSFKAEANPAGMKLNEYRLAFTLTNAKATTLILHRPKQDFATDLVAVRQESPDKYAVNTETALTGQIVTKGFTYHYRKEDSITVKKIIDKVESSYQSLLNDFNVSSMPNVTVRLYPDLNLYHNAVNTPLAAAWQQGKGWGTNNYQEIRVYAPQSPGQISDLTLGFAVHEFVHLLTLQLSPNHQRPPVWLWEGLAIYKGCCQWSQPGQLTYLKKGSYPSFKDIDRQRDYEKSYELGYYVIEFLIDKWGWDTVLALIQSGGNVQAALGVSPKQFDKDFFSFVSTKYNLNQK